MIDKLPLIEYVYRWIDIYTYLHYPECVREEAYRIININQERLGYPHVAACAALWISCSKNNIKFEEDLIQKITKAHRFKTSIEPGMFLHSVKKKVKEWKS